MPTSADGRGFEVKLAQLSPAAPWKPLLPFALAYPPTSYFAGKTITPPLPPIHPPRPTAITSAKRRIGRHVCKERATAERAKTSRFMAFPPADVSLPPQPAQPSVHGLPQPLPGPATPPRIHRSRPSGLRCTSGRDESPTGARAQARET